MAERDGDKAGRIRKLGAEADEAEEELARLRRSLMTRVQAAEFTRRNDRRLRYGAYLLDRALTLDLALASSDSERIAIVERYESHVADLHERVLRRTLAEVGVRPLVDPPRQDGETSGS